MSARSVIRFGGAVLSVVGVVLLTATGWLASGLGVSTSAALPGGGDPLSMSVWYQLAFMRLFGTALIGLAIVFWWGSSHLTAAQQVSLVRVLSVVLGTLALMTMGQQIAVWNSTTGWVLAGTLMLTAATCAGSTLRQTAAPAS